MSAKNSAAGLILEELSGPRPIFTSVLAGTGRLRQHSTVFLAIISLTVFRRRSTMALLGEGKEKYIEMGIEVHRKACDLKSKGACFKDS